MICIFVFGRVSKIYSSINPEQIFEKVSIASPPGGNIPADRDRRSEASHLQPDFERTSERQTDFDKSSKASLRVADSASAYGMDSEGASRHPEEGTSPQVGSPSGAPGGLRGVSKASTRTLAGSSVGGGSVSMGAGHRPAKKKKPEPVSLTLALVNARRQVLILKLQRRVQKKAIPQLHVAMLEEGDTGEMLHYGAYQVGRGDLVLYKWAVVVGLSAWAVRGAGGAVSGVAASLAGAINPSLLLGLQRGTEQMEEATTTSHVDGIGSDHLGRRGSSSNLLAKAVNPEAVVAPPPPPAPAELRRRTTSDSRSTDVAESDHVLHRSLTDLLSGPGPGDHGGMKGQQSSAVDTLARISAGLLSGAYDHRLTAPDELLAVLLKALSDDLLLGYIQTVFAPGGLVTFHSLPKQHSASTSSFTRGESPVLTVPRKQESVLLSSLGREDSYDPSPKTDAVSLAGVSAGGSMVDPSPPPQPETDQHLTFLLGEIFRALETELSQTLKEFYFFLALRLSRKRRRMSLFDGVASPRIMSMSPVVSTNGGKIREKAPAVDPNSPSTGALPESTPFGASPERFLMGESNRLGQSGILSRHRKILSILKEICEDVVAAEYMSADRRRTHLASSADRRRTLDIFYSDIFSTR